MTRWIVTLSTLAVLALSAAPAQASHGVFALGINIGGPVYRPYPYYAPYYYRPYYPVYVAPAPVYVAPAPIVVQPAPVCAPTVPVVTRSNGYEQQTTQPAAYDPNSAATSRYLQQLFDQEERVRSDAAMELGRMRADRAVEPLCTLVSTDRSPLVREAAARALGLIGSQRGLAALQQAAQADGDRDVRRSAQFSAEVIRTNLRRD